MVVGCRGREDGSQRMLNNRFLSAATTNCRCRGPGVGGCGREAATIRPSAHLLGDRLWGALGRGGRACPVPAPPLSPACSS